MSSAAQRHAEVAAWFTDRVLGVPEDRWDAPSPVEGWAARDVVRHLVTWFPDFLHAGTGLRLAPVPSVDEDPVGAWLAHRDAVQELLDDPASATRSFDHPQVGSMPLPDAVSRFYTADVFMHTWDLARATGQDDTLDPDLCAELYEGMRPIEPMLRASGQFGSRVDVAEDADVQTQLLALIGRRR